MRLQSKEIQTIIQIAKDIYGETVQVFLFGSRLKLHLGDQKIDVIGDHEDSPVVQEALKNGIQLI